MSADAATGARWALVTGASRGIGAAIASELAARGFAVALNFRRDAAAAAKVAAAIEAAGGQALLAPGDVADPAAVEAMWRTLDRHLETTGGVLEVLVCNAGVIRDTLLGTSEARDFDDVLRVNLTGVVDCCRQALRRLVPRRRGAIVTISSVAAQRPGRGPEQLRRLEGGGRIVHARARGRAGSARHPRQRRRTGRDRYGDERRGARPRPRRGRRANPAPPSGEARGGRAGGGVPLQR